MGAEQVKKPYDVFYTPHCKILMNVTREVDEVTATLIGRNKVFYDVYDNKLDKHLATFDDINKVIEFARGYNEFCNASPLGRKER